VHQGHQDENVHCEYAQHELTRKPSYLRNTPANRTFGPKGLTSWNSTARKLHSLVSHA